MKYLTTSEELRDAQLNKTLLRVEDEGGIYENVLVNNVTRNGSATGNTPNGETVAILLKRDKISKM